MDHFVTVGTYFASAGAQKARMGYAVGDELECQLLIMIILCGSYILFLKLKFDISLQPALYKTV